MDKMILAAYEREMREAINAINFSITELSKDNSDLDQALYALETAQNNLIDILK